MERLAQHPNVVGCKLSHGNLDDHALIGLSPKIDHNKFHVFTGLGQQLISVLDVGGAGAIDGLAACFPKSLVKLYNLFETRERQEAGKDVIIEMRGLQYRVCKAEKLVVRWGTMGIREAVARLRNFGDNDGGRFPTKGGFPNGDSDWKSWCEAIDALHEVESELEKQG
jgi:2-keto-3-deoxy-L-rhamnonate aldolase